MKPADEAGESGVSVSFGKRRLLFIPKSVVLGFITFMASFLRRG